MNSKRFLLIFSLITLVVAAFYIVKANGYLSSGQVPHKDSTAIKAPALIPDTAIYQIKPDPRSAQQDIGSYFAPPLHGELSLSGTFAELRTNHFHGGLDIRTGGQQGKAVLASAPGYVTRVKVSPWGYGKALYIQHPNGKQTVYGHLKFFNGKIQDEVIKQHYTQKSFPLDWYPKAGQLRVLQGDTIAWSGNTGGSGGPHLHFEIRDGRTSEPLNPLLHGIKIKDTIPPYLRSMYLFEIDNDYRDRNGYYPYRSLGDNTDTAYVNPGTYGLGIRWIDYFVDRMSKLGINYATLDRDGMEIFSQTIEKFAFDEGRLINVHMDYALSQSRGMKIVKLFKDRGNSLRFYKGIDNGKIILEEGEVTKLTLKVKDVEGQNSEMRVVLKATGNSSKFTKRRVDMGTDSMFVRSSAGATIKGDYYRVNIPASSLIYNSWVGWKEYDNQIGKASRMVRVHYDLAPFRSSYTIALKPKLEYKHLMNKLVVMSYNPKTKQSKNEGGRVEGEFVSARMKKFGYFFLKPDTIAPRATIKSIGKNIRIRVSDNLSGVDSYMGTVDGKWILLEYEPKASLLFGRIPPSIGKGPHVFKLKLTDSKGNVNTISRKFNI